jgi:uncharacterized protein (DUF58 family)
LYRSFLLSSIPFLLLLGAALGLWALVALGAAWALYLGGSWARARRGLGGLSARREVYPSAFEGDDVLIDLVLESHRPLRELEIVDAFGPSLSLEQRMLEPGPLGPGLRRRLRYQSRCSRQWGLFAVGPIRVGRCDPGGMFHAERTLEVVEEFAVFPRVFDVAGLLPLGTRASFETGPATAGQAGQSLVYLGARDYRPGDEARRIHWPQSARRGSLVVKEVEVDLTPYFTLLLDLERRHRAGTGKKSTREFVVRTAASVVWSATQAGSFVQVIGEGRSPLEVPPGRGQNHLTHALYELLCTAQEGTRPFLDIVRDALPRIPPQSTAVLIGATVFLALPVLEELLQAFRGRAVRPVVVLINNFSFPAISGWPPPRAEVLEKAREVTFFLESRGVPTRVLEESDDLESVLGGEGLGP